MIMKIVFPDGSWVIGDRNNKAVGYILTMRPREPITTLFLTETNLSSLLSGRR
jgi:hypothetical protein